MSDPVGVPTIVLWRSPANRLHRHQNCSSNGRRKETKKTKVTIKEFDAARADAKVCGCIITDPFKRSNGWLR